MTEVIRVQPPLDAELDPVVVQALERGLGERFGHELEVVDIRRRALTQASTYPIERLSLELRSGETVSVVFKQLVPLDPSKGNRSEVLIYRRLLLGGRFGAPFLYASVYDEELGRYWLFLEDVGPRHMSHGLNDCLSAARSLGRIHGAYLGREEELRALDCLPEHDADHYEAVAARARRSLALAGAEEPIVERFERVMEDFSQLARYLDRQPRTLVHGEVIKHNFIVDRNGSLRPVDWESAAVGAGLFDLAMLTYKAGSDRRPIAQAYVREVQEHAPVPTCWDEFEDVIACCDVIVALLFGGWSTTLCLRPTFAREFIADLEWAWAQRALIRT